VRRSSACNIPSAEGEDAEASRGATAHLAPQGRGHQRLPIQPSTAADADRVARRAPRDRATAPRPAVPGPSVPGGPRAPASQRQGAASQRHAAGLGDRGGSRPAPGGRGRQAWSASLTLEWCSRARREGRRDARPRGTAWPEEAAAGTASPMAQGPRWRTRAGAGGVRPGGLTRCSVPPGELCTTETVPHGSVGGRGNRRVSDLARGLPNLLRRSRFRQRLTPGVRPQSWRSVYTLSLESNGFLLLFVLTLYISFG